MRFLELMDEVSLVENKMEAPAYNIEREGVIKGSITLNFLDKIGDKIFAVCKVDDLTTNLLLTVENRLPVGLTRETMLEEEWGFLFENNEGKCADWQFVDTIFDSNNMAEMAEYKLRNEFQDDYTETPPRDLFPGKLEVKLALYYPVGSKIKNIDGIMAIEVGSDLQNKSGLVTYYNFREIPETDVNYL